MSLWFIPLYVLFGLVLLLGVFALLARVRGGRYLRPVVAVLAKVPLLRRGLAKASKAALERENPALASAIAKLERAGAVRDPRRAEAALSRLTPAERRAYLEAAGEQNVMPQPTNRAQRRHLERARKGSRPKR
jgi:hypothetical protein